MMFTKTDNIKLKNSEKLDYLSPAKVYDIPSLEENTFVGDNSDIMIPGRPSTCLDNPLKMIEMN